MAYNVPNDYLNDLELVYVHEAYHLLRNGRVKIIEMFDLNQRNLIGAFEYNKNCDLIHYSGNGYNCGPNEKVLIKKHES